MGPLYNFFEFDVPVNHLPSLEMATQKDTEIDSVSVVGSGFVKERMTN